MKILKNDNVMIISGKDRGKTGVVSHTFPSDGQLIVKGVNLVKRHQKKNQRNPQGGIIEKFKPVSISKVSLICPHCLRPSRIGFLIKNNDEKIRICHKCKSSLDSPK